MHAFMCIFFSTQKYISMIFLCASYLYFTSTFPLSLFTNSRYFISFIFIYFLYVQLLCSIFIAFVHKCHVACTFFPLTVATQSADPHKGLDFYKFSHYSLHTLAHIGIALQLCRKFSCNGTWYIYAVSYYIDCDFFTYYLLTIFYVC